MKGETEYCYTVEQEGWGEGEALVTGQRFREDAEVWVGIPETE